MKIYLDTCAIQRPLDERSHLRLALEADAILSIIELCELGQLTIISSEAVLYEIQRIADNARQQKALEIIGIASIIIQTTSDIQAKAQSLMAYGIRFLDALHLASAQKANVDFFCTTDDKLLRQSQKIPDLQLKVLSPLGLIQEIG